LREIFCVVCAIKNNYNFEENLRPTVRNRRLQFAKRRIDSRPHPSAIYTAGANLFQGQESIVMIFFILLGLVLGITGVIGCIVPVIPGPFFSFSALLVVSFAESRETYQITFLVIMGALMLLVTILDFVIPAAAARRYGASRPGIWGSLIGMVLGMVLFPPLGVFIGALAGAVTGELLNGGIGRQALGAGWGIFIGNMASIAVKLAYCTFILFLCLKALF